MKKLGDNIRREQEHRDKVYDKYKNNGKRVKEMIASFEQQVMLEFGEVNSVELRSLVDSNVSPDLKMVAQALSENQLNLEAFNQTIGQKDFPNCSRLADDVKDEHKATKRKVAVETAKRVLLQFYKAIEKAECST